MTWPACAGCGQPATCYGVYEGDEPAEPAYACNDCCAHGNEDGWCRPVDGINEEAEEAEPGPCDILCHCGCGSVAFYMCRGEDLVGDAFELPCCVFSMKELSADARAARLPFKATPNPKPSTPPSWSTVDELARSPE